jgi:hypothetical protein
MDSSIEERPVTMVFKTVRLRNGQPFVYIVLLLGIFVIGFAYVILSKPMATVYNMVFNNSVMMNDTYQTFFSQTKTIWDFILLPIAIALIIWAIIKIQQRDDIG